MKPSVKRKKRALFDAFDRWRLKMDRSKFERPILSFEAGFAAGQLFAELEASGLEPFTIGDAVPFNGPRGMIRQQTYKGVIYRVRDTFGEEIDD